VRRHEEVAGAGLNSRRHIQRSFHDAMRRPETMKPERYAMRGLLQRRKGGIFNETVNSSRSLHSSQTCAPETVAPARAGSTPRRIWILSDITRQFQPVLGLSKDSLRAIEQACREWEKRERRRLAAGNRQTPRAASPREKQQRGANAVTPPAGQRHCRGGPPDQPAWTLHSARARRGTAAK
jgi:hypothetical protein